MTRRIASNDPGTVTGYVTAGENRASHSPFPCPFFKTGEGCHRNVEIDEKMTETHGTAPHENGFPEDGKTADLDR